MKILYPYLNTTQKFIDYIKIFDNFSDNYNKDKDLCEQLRAGHRELYFTLIQIAKTTLVKHNKVFDNAPEFRIIDNTQDFQISTNRRILGKRLKREKSTIHRYIKRLMKAKVIKKIKHGPTSNFDLLISPDFLLIFDKNAPNYIPTSKFSDTENQLITNDKIATCKDVLVNLPEHSNNIISNVNKVSDISDIQPQKQSNKQTKTPQSDNLQPQITQPKNNPKQPQHNQNALKQQKMDKETNLIWVKKSFTAWIYKYLIATLFVGREIYSAEKEKTMQYILQNYFEHCHTQIACEKYGKQLKWRVDAVARYIKKNKFDFSNIYPYQYMNLNNKSSGFVNTKKWYENHVKYLKTKALNKQKSKNYYADFDKLNLKINYLKNNYTLPAYKEVEMYVKQNIPYLLKDFYSRIDFNGIN